MSKIDDLFQKYLNNKKGISVPDPIANLNMNTGSVKSNVSESKKYWVWGEIPSEMKPSADTKALAYYYKHCNDLPF